MKQEQTRLRAEADAARARWIEAMEAGRKLELAGLWSMVGVLLLLAGGSLLGALSSLRGWW